MFWCNVRMNDVHCNFARICHFLHNTGSGTDLRGYSICFLPDIYIPYMEVGVFILDIKQLYLPLMVHYTTYSLDMLNAI